MLVLSNRLFYALEAVFTIAYESAHQPVASRELAARQQLSPRYLEPLLQKLVRAGYITSIRGAQGGYVITPEQQLRSVSAIIAALGDDDATLPPAVTAVGEAIVLPLVHTLQQQQQQQLSTLTLADICASARAKHLPIASPLTADFAI